MVGVAHRLMRGWRGCPRSVSDRLIYLSLLHEEWRVVRHIGRFIVDRHRFWALRICPPKEMCTMLLAATLRWNRLGCARPLHWLPNQKSEVMIHYTI